MKKRVAKKLRALSKVSRESYRNLKAQWNTIPRPERKQAEHALDRVLADVQRKAEIRAKKLEEHRLRRMFAAFADL